VNRKTARQKPGGFFVLSKIELGCVVTNLNQRATLGHVRSGAHPVLKSASRFVKQAPIDDIADLA
jgi:hypothetical protein